MSDEVQALRVAARRSPIDAIEKDVARHGGDDVVHAPVIDGDQRPAALQRLDKLRAVDGVDEDNQVRLILAGALGKGLNAHFLGEDRVGLHARQLGELAPQRLDDEVFRLLVDGLGEVQFGLLDVRICDLAPEGG